MIASMLPLEEHSRIFLLHPITTLAPPQHHDVPPLFKMFNLSPAPGVPKNRIQLNDPNHAKLSHFLICAYTKVAYLFDHPGTVFYAVFMSFWGEA